MGYQSIAGFERGSFRATGDVGTGIAVSARTPRRALRLDVRLEHELCTTIREY
jgi:hypothetical protein